MTVEQKAGAWDGLKKAMTAMSLQTTMSCEGREMARGFLEIINQLEEKVTAQTTEQPETKE